MEDDSDEEEEAVVRINDIPFQERILKIADGTATRRHSGREAGPASRGVTSEARLTAKRKATDEGEEPSLKRVNKNAPVEEKIARRPVDPLRDSVQRKGVHRRDPRYTSATGKPDEPASRKCVS